MGDRSCGGLLATRCGNAFGDPLMYFAFDPADCAATVYDVHAAWKASSDFKLANAFALVACYRFNLR